MITAPPAQWDEVVDVVVLGSGAAGLSAAVAAHDAGADVLVLEKAPLIGGTAGVSGGIVWVPLNRHEREAGIVDTREDALTYIRRLTLGREPDPELVETFVDRAHEVMDRLEESTPLRLMVSLAFTDYYADLPGGRPEGGRSLEPLPYDARTELGPWAAKVRTTPHMARLTMDEGAQVLLGGSLPEGIAEQREAADVRVLGPGLVAPLVKALLDRDVPLVTGARADELVMVDGEVVGVSVLQAGRPRLIGARRGVILCCGGFEWNPAMVKTFIGERIEPMSPPHNEGDGHRMAMEAGAELANMTAFWGQPALHDPEVQFEGRPMIQMGGSRAFPGVIVVNAGGQRFVNEASTYQDFPKTVGAYDPSAVGHPNEEHWMVFDQAVKDGATILPSVPPTAPAPAWIARADTLRALAGLVGIDPDGLEATVARWNAAVAAGEDPDFRRGTLWYEGFMTGGPDAAACLAPVQTGPFYAARLVHGALGTSGGARTDADGRVRSMRGGVVPRLYAAGNAAPSVFGAAYPGGGATLGPALTFGYLAGQHAGAQAARTLGETAPVRASA